MGDRPLLHLVAIMKDEASCIEKTLESVERHVDGFTILDTGSTDGTQEIIRAWQARTGLPGRVCEEPFVDFAASRNRVLELDAEGDNPPVFTLMLSSDETLDDGDALRAFLESERGVGNGVPASGAYGVELRAGAQVWTYPRVLRTGGGWRYVGKVHEIPVGSDGTTAAPLASGGRVIHVVSDAARRARRIREFDLPTLQALVDDESYTLAERVKAIFFLAETHNVLAAGIAEAAKGSPEPGGPYISHQMAAMALYWRAGRLMESEGDPAHDHDKAIHAYFRYFNTAEKIGLFSHEELIERLEGLAQAGPKHPEVRYMIAVHATQVDVRRGLFLAEEAARVAREAREHPTHIPTDARVEWMSLRVAAECARALKKDAQSKALAAAALEAGAPREVLEGLL